MSTKFNTQPTAERATSDCARGGLHGESASSADQLPAAPFDVPCGGIDGIDVAQGTVWSYVHGYLRILQRGPPLSERLRPLATDQHRIVPRLLLLCPLDGRLPDAIDALHDRLVPVGSAASFVANVAGAHGRAFGAHKAFEITAVDGGSGRGLLAAVETVASLRTMRAVAEAMAACERPLPRLDVREIVRQFVAALRAVVAQDAALRDLVRLVVYDPARDGDAFAALLAAAEDAGPEPSPPPPLVRPPLPVGVGVFMAWSFFRGFLQLVSRTRDVSRELTALQEDTKLPVPLKKIVELCPEAPGWMEAGSAGGAGGAAAPADDLTSLDARLERVRDVCGVDVGVPALAGRTYGSFSIYRVRGLRSRHSVDYFALELVTPLRTLALGLAREGRDPEEYRRQARSFTAELQTLLREHPTVADQFVALRVESGADIYDQLAGLLEPQVVPGGSSQRQQKEPEVRPRSCNLI